MTRPKPVVFLFSEDRTSNQLSALRNTPHSAPCSDDSPTWQRSCNRPWQVKKTKTLGYGMIQPPACDPGSATRSKQNTAHLCSEIMAKKVEVLFMFPICPAENHRSHPFRGPLPGESALSWRTKEADKKSSCSAVDLW